MDTPISTPENEHNESMMDTSFTPLLTIDEATGKLLITAAKWGKFLGIVGFILTGLIAIMALFMGSIMAEFKELAGPAATAMGGGVSFIYFLVALFYFFPSFYLFKYSSKLQSAIQLNDNALLSEAFKNQKSLYLFMGITTAIVLTLYAVLLLFGLLFAAAM